MTRPYLRLGVGVALTAAALPAAAIAATHHSAAPAAQARDLKVSVSGQHVTVTGSVKLTPDTKIHRLETGVAIKLTGAGGYDRDVVFLSPAGTFKRIFDTALTGKLTVSAQAIEGISHYLGTKISRTVTVSAPASTSSTSTTTASTGTTPSITTTTAPAGEVPLVGTFDIGSGSYFEMLDGAAVVPNPSSTSGVETPLTGGTDGGLETFGYQAAPSPAFAKATSGNALAARVVQPVPFEGVNFTIQTSAIDAQATSAADPVPVIYTNAAGLISGQVTAWDAQWNGLSFNQGTPKPDGSTPSPTTALSGTYDYATGAYTLNWKSLIQGGPFNGFTGSWHLQGTFRPAAFS